MADDAYNSTDITAVSVLGKNSIHCGFHLVPYIVGKVVETLSASTYVLITDETVAKYHLDKFQDEFDSLLSSKASASRFLAHVIPPGETSKCREGKAAIEDYLLSQSCTRDTVILALGGGVIGDLVGFVAATFMRGVRFVQIPTTLLAMVDSSVGGKTAIDTPHGKNLIGAFWQPEYIFIDAAFLETLPAREFSNGMAEVVKTAAIWNEEEFSALESRSAEVFAAIQTTSLNNAGRTKATRSEAQGLLLRVITGSISVKAHIVTIDERETGLRNLVNFGHTIGHAIEAVLTPTILHGECVSIGMILEAEIARSMDILSQVAVGRLTRALKAYNLPISVHDPRISAVPASKVLTVDRLLDIMKVDKKNSGPAKKVVLLSRIGATYEPKATVVQDNIIRKSLSDAVKVVSGVPKNSPVTMATPGSKSISNRALVLAALAGGTCRLKNLLHSDDTQVMMAALSDLKGATFSWEDNGDTLVVHGGGGNLVPPPVGKEVYLQNAGTAARFMTTVCALVRSPEGDKHTIVTGNARMKQRPIGPLVDALRTNGIEIAYQESEGCLPLKVRAHKNGFAGGHIKLAASVSSQYVSSILLCAPYAREAVVLELIGGQVISQPYIDMTIAMMHTFGVQVTRRKDESTGRLLDIYDIPKVAYISPPVYSIESDASSATYPLAIAALTGTTCTLENIGSASLQGDAGFAKSVLEPMGCKVVQTEDETTVTGPPVGQLRAIGLVDMETMTDAFLTASVLAAVANAPSLTERSVETESGRPNTTRILGIANQRVKECNRIKAMVDELAKFGVETKELDDGLEIYGKPIEELKTGVSVHCYDDHRVAMAFSVLGSTIRGTVLEEKRCVEKTWPNWWDDLENKIGLSVEGVDIHAEAASKSQTNKHPDASVLLIGMRGAGKSYLGHMAASELGWEYLDADAFLEQRSGVTCKEYVHQNGWEAFRKAETAILSELLELKAEKTIISLGGGIVETPSARDVLKEYKARRGPIVYISRDIKEIVDYLTEETERPAYGEEIEEVYKRRTPWFHECSSHEFISLTTLGDGETLKRTAKAQAAVRTYFGHITGLSPNLANLTNDRKSYFLSLTFPDIATQRHLLDESLGEAAVLAGIDAVELRVDLLSPSGSAKAPNAPSIEYVTEQLVLLRCFTNLPIVYTVRTVSQGGAFPDQSEDHLFSLLDTGLRLGAEYIDVETTLPHARIQKLAKRKGSSKIIASYHDWSGKLSWNGPEVQAQYTLGAGLGDIVKIVGKANTIEDNFSLRQFVQKVSTSPSAKPLIAINMGAAGQLSRILNTTFTPVTHPALPVAAAPGQLSVSQINSALHLTGQIPEKRFYLFGDPIGQSPSPTLHNTAFQTLGLPHKYDIYPSTAESLEALKSIVASPDFGGASVTIPLKLAVIPLIDTLSHAGRIIGAINTIVPVTKPDGGIELYGDNTDWIGIQRVILARSTGKWSASDVGLIIGAGGTARAAVYALHRLGLGKILIYNRTLETAKTVIAGFPISFNIHVVEDLKDLEKESPAIVIGTVPASATTSGAEGEGLFLSNSIFSRSEGGIIVDMAYRPHKTPLLELAGQISTLLWQQVSGVEVLLEQGYEQFNLWTGSKPPVKIVEKAVLSFYHSSSSLNFS